MIEIVGEIGRPATAEEIAAYEDGDPDAMDPATARKMIEIARTEPEIARLSREYRKHGKRL